MSKTNSNTAFPVIIADFHPQVNGQGEAFMQLELQQEGLRQRQSDGTLYMGTNKCRITSAWDKAKCEAYKGQALPGNWQITKVECPAYKYVVDGVEETFTHTWVLLPA